MTPPSSHDEANAEQLRLLLADMKLIRSEREAAQHATPAACPETGPTERREQPGPDCCQADAAQVGPRPGPQRRCQD